MHMCITIIKHGLLLSKRLHVLVSYLICSVVLHSLLLPLLDIVYRVVQYLLDVFYVHVLVSVFIDFNNIWKRN